MQGRQGIGQPGDDRHRLRGSERPVPQSILKSTAGQEFDDQERAAPPGVDAADAASGPDGGGRRVCHTASNPLPLEGDDLG